MRHPAYQQTQMLWLLWVLLPGCAGAVLGTVLPAEGAPFLPGLLVVGLVIALLLGFLLTMGRLTVEIGTEAIEWRFGLFGRPRWQVALADVVTVAPARSTWIEGWGIRKTADGMLYNASGFDAVRLTLRDGRVIRLGSPEPQRLISFIEARLPAR